jgi:dihydrofolate reductase
MFRPIKNLSLIAAFWKNNYGIGFNNKLPWSKCAPDMNFFKKITSGDKNGLIMGRNTMESIPKKYFPFSDRISIVVSKTMQEKVCPRSYSVFSSVDNAISGGFDILGCNNLYLIGGSQIYQSGMKYCSHAYITEFDFGATEIDADTFFPHDKLSNLFQLVHLDIMYNVDVSVNNKIVTGNLLFKRYVNKN